MLISSLFNPGKTVLSFEFFPPKNDAAEEQLIATYDSLRPFQPDFVSVTYGAGGSTRDRSLAVSKELNDHRHCAVMAHLTCLSHNEDELGAIADRLWESGIVNIMALRGDPPRTADQTPLKKGCFSYSGELIEFLRNRHDFCCGGGCYPEGHTETPDIATGIEHLKHKIEAGCEFLITQMFFDKDNYFRFVEQIRRAGITVPVIPGIMPLTGFSQASKFESKFGVKLPAEMHRRLDMHKDDVEAISALGIDWATEQCAALIYSGAPGIHFYTLNRSRATHEVCERLQLGRRDNLVPAV